MLVCSNNHFMDTKGLHMRELVSQLDLRWKKKRVTTKETGHFACLSIFLQFEAKVPKTIIEMVTTLPKECICKPLVCIKSVRVLPSTGESSRDPKSATCNVSIRSLWGAEDYYYRGKKSPRNWPVSEERCQCSICGTSQSALLVTAGQVDGERVHKVRFIKAN